MKISRSWLCHCLMCLMAMLLLSGCATAPLREAVPQSLLDQASIPHLPEIRFWGDERSAGLDRSLSTRIDQVFASGRAAGLKPGSLVDVSYLALSGGGGDGAFGAGLLNGWSRTGSRPQFEIVTGVSTGALMAPFAFLGSNYDDELHELYTTTSTKELAQPQIFAAIFGADAIASNAPLAKRIDSAITPAVLAAVASEHRKGRRLYVATTNLDAQRQVIWDMGAIAASGNAKAVGLFRNVLLASSAIPGVFPPVRIEVHAGGRDYEELHVDGGTTGQVFFLPVQATLEDYTRGRANVRINRHLFVVRNTKVAPEWQKVDDKALNIVERSLSTLTKSQGVGDLYKLYVEANRQRIDFNYAAIPSQFSLESKEPFDPAYMQSLFELGQDLGSRGYPWQKTPPGLERQVER